jgi:hypothetical protein
VVSGVEPDVLLEAGLGEPDAALEDGGVLLHVLLERQVTALFHQVLFGGLLPAGGQQQPDRPTSTEDDGADGPDRLETEPVNREQGPPDSGGHQHQTHRAPADHSVRQHLAGG